MFGIYIFENKHNGKKYIGQSKHIPGRIKQHLREARGNRKNTHFYNALRKNKDLEMDWKITYFSLEEIKVFSCYQEILNKIEQTLIHRISLHPKGYNLSGEVLHKETKKKISKILSGKSMSEENRSKISKALRKKYAKEKHHLKGTKWGDEQSKKLLPTRKGERNGRSKLNWEKVNEIRSLHSSGKSQREIWKLFPEVNESQIWKVVHNYIWKV